MGGDKRKDWLEEELHRFIVHRFGSSSCPFLSRVISALAARQATVGAFGREQCKQKTSAWYGVDSESELYQVRKIWSGSAWRRCWSRESAWERPRRQTQNKHSHTGSLSRTRGPSWSATWTTSAFALYSILLISQPLVF